jgi:Fe-S cluster biogenesis protein NfuA
MNSVVASTSIDEPGFDQRDVETVLEAVRPYLVRHGGDVELVSVDGANVRVRLRGACTSCPSASVTLRFAVEQKLREELPGFGELVAESALERAAPKRWWSLLG